MAYLGVKGHENLDGLYYFSSISMGESIAAQIDGSEFYPEKLKKKAFLDFNCTQETLKDGRILMDKFKNITNDLAYLCITGTPFDGVYMFKHTSIRNRIAKDFDNAFLTMDKAEALSKFNVGESEIQDGGFLLSYKVQEWIKSNKKVKEKRQKQKEKQNSAKNALHENENKEVVESSVVSVSSDIDKENVSRVDSGEAVKMPILDSQLFRAMVESVASKGNNETKKNDVVEITMSTGDKYRIALRQFFYMDSHCDFSNSAYTDGTGNVILKEKVIDNLLDCGEITVVEPTKIKYKDGFVILLNCDDVYSPDIVTEKTGKTKIVHSISRIVLNVSQIVSVMGYEYYSEINLIKLTEEKNKLVYNYLVSKFKG